MDPPSAHPNQGGRTPGRAKAANPVGVSWLTSTIQTWWVRPLNGERLKRYTDDPDQRWVRPQVGQRLKRFPDEHKRLGPSTKRGKTDALPDEVSGWTTAPAIDVAVGARDEDDSSAVDEDETIPIVPEDGDIKRRDEFASTDSDDSDDSDDTIPIVDPVVVDSKQKDEFASTDSDDSDDSDDTIPIVDPVVVEVQGPPRSSPKNGGHAEQPPTTEDASRGSECSCCPVGEYLCAKHDSEVCAFTSRGCGSPGLEYDTDPGEGEEKEPGEMVKCEVVPDKTESGGQMS